MLTTITPYWNRPAILRVWFGAVAGATFDGLQHIVFFIGEPVPEWVREKYGADPRFQLVSFPNDKPGNLSIGHYHNLGAQLATTEWMMKMDVDTLPNVRYFRELTGLLTRAQPRQWFNGGMAYVTQEACNRFLRHDQMPLSEETYRLIMNNAPIHCGPSFSGPVATNFICRRAEYLQLGGCDERFRGYGWEDYQQLYMLEKYYLGTDPLPGGLTVHNVTRRCCAEISRRRARELWRTNNWLCLLHQFHHASPDASYKSHNGIIANRNILMDYINNARKRL